MANLQKSLADSILYFWSNGNELARWQYYVSLSGLKGNELACCQLAEESKWGLAFAKTNSAIKELNNLFRSTTSVMQTCK